jgi:hypothetical protein
MLRLPQRGQNQTRRAPHSEQNRPLFQRPQCEQRHMGAPVLAPGGLFGIALLLLFSTAACQEETILETTCCRSGAEACGCRG